MAHRLIALSSLLVNRANDRHGELENETAAFAWLFNNLEQRMKNLANDIVTQGEVYEPPLVRPEGDTFVVYDGNRRITCLKLLQNPRKAPTVELQEFFARLRSNWSGDFPDHIECQIEEDRDRIDDILYRRHTGSQSGVGQSNWDDRMKLNFINRTGKESGVNIAEEVEKILAQEGKLPTKKVPRSNLNRLLSSETIRNRVGISLTKGRIEFLHQEPVVVHALHRIADDLANKRKTLDDVWDLDAKRAYLDELEKDRVLPTAEHAIIKPAPQKPSQPASKSNPQPRSQPQRRTTLIPNAPYAIIWSGRLQRHRAIWEELQFRLHLSETPNAISALFRMLLELSVENYISQTSLSTVKDHDTFARRTLRVAEDLHANGKITDKYLDVFRKFPQYDALVSADTFHRYVHSPNFAPSPDHLNALWDTLSEFTVQCLSV
jgi:hypothetical protein